MSSATFPRTSDHPVHLDPIDRAIALLVDSDLSGEFVCDGSCGGAASPSLASCTLAPIDGLPTAA